MSRTSAFHEQGCGIFEGLFVFCHEGLAGAVRGGVCVGVGHSGVDEWEDGFIW